MVAVITYRFIGEEVLIHCKDRYEYGSALRRVQDLVKRRIVLDYHAYECVEIEGAFT